MDINLESYRVFYYVASCGSFSQAAQRLYLSQSAVSQSIKALEQKLSVKLFTRSSRKVSLTPSGQLLFSHVEPAMNLLLQGEARLIQPDSLSHGQLHIAASDTICRYFLVPYLRQFHLQYPDLTIKVTNQTSIHCTDMLLHEEVDVALVNVPNPSLSSLLYTKPVLTFEDCFVAGSSFSQLKGESLTLKDLLSYPLLTLSSPSATSDFLHQLFQKDQLELQPEIELTSNDLLIDLARINLGIAFVPDYCIPTGAGDLFRLSLKNELPRRQIHAACLSSRKEQALLVAFLSLLPEIS